MAVHPWAWLRRVIGSKDETKPQETISAGPNPQLAPKPGSTGETRLRETITYQDDTPPPSYTTLELRGSTPRPPIESVSLEALRARNPPRADSDIVGPPPHNAAAPMKAAAAAAVNGYLRAQDEKDPLMVAARTAKAIAIAASTCGSYGAFVAAVTAVESAALLAVEDARRRAPYGQLRDRTRRAVHAAANTALAANADTTRAGPCHTAFSA